MELRSRVCVLGAEVVQDLFPLEPALGKTLRIDSDYYTVIGIMKKLNTKNAEEGKEQAASVQSGERRIFIPLSAASAQFGDIIVKESSGSREVEKVEYHEITVRVENLDQVVETSLIIDDLLDRYHDKRDYEMIVPLELLRQAKETARNFNIVLGAIAAISLIVGGIGIMNIMLATVTERTREIGIRRALGARRKDIVLQFLIETVILSSTGGLIGVGLGIAIPYFIEVFADMPTIVTFWSPFVAFTISAVVGLVFGLYPAARAADMHPVEALRHE